MSDWTWADWLVGSLAFTALIGACVWAWAHPGIGKEGRRR